MIKKKFSKLIGLNYQDFCTYIETGQVTVQNARLIPHLKTGDEGALTSIFLSAIKLIKEYKDSIFKELKLSKSGKAYYFTEVIFHDIDKNSRLDGLIIIVSKGVIKDAAIFEMKNKNNCIDKEQIEKYIGLSKKIGVNRIVTVSNEFVADPSISPIKIKLPKNFSLYHFSWTYLMTKGQLLLFKNDNNIKDEDQVEIMKEVLFYIENPLSGVSGYHVMKPGWKEAVDKIHNRISLKQSENCVLEAVESWYEEEKDIALLLSRKLGVLVKSSPRSKASLKDDIIRLIKEQELHGILSIKILVDFEVKTVSMSVKVIPPLNKGTKARITWIGKQLETAKGKNEEIFSTIEDGIFVEANVKHARKNIRVPLTDFDYLIEETIGKEIQSFNIVLMSKFKAGFGSNKKFIVLIEKMILDYYAGIVQYLTNWNRPAPKL